MSEPGHDRAMHRRSPSSHVGYAGDAPRACILSTGNEKKELRSDALSGQNRRSLAIDYLNRFVSVLGGSEKLPECGSFNLATAIETTCHCAGNYTPWKGKPFGPTSTTSSLSRPRQRHPASGSEGGSPLQSRRSGLGSTPAPSSSTTTTPTTCRMRTSSSTTRTRRRIAASKSPTRARSSGRRNV